MGLDDLIPEDEQEEEEDEVEFPDELDEDLKARLKRLSSIAVNFDGLLDDINHQLTVMQNRLEKLEDRVEELESEEEQTDDDDEGIEFDW